jgi:exonuclease SbcC
MIIETVELHNIKSYDGQGCSIDFRPGVNLIWGENGSGKTTILEAIGYCLFDSLDYNLDQFTREGATEGEAILTFKHQDGRSYSIVREIRNSGGLKIRDVATGRYLTTKRKDAEDWLNEQLGVEFGKYGKDLFQNAIGVSQGKMVGSFAVAPAARKKIFDPILRVDEYDQAYKKLADTRHRLDDELRTAQIEKSLLKGRLEQLPSKKKLCKALTEQVLNGEREMEMAQEQLSSLKEELSLLDQILLELVKLDNAISTTKQDLSNLVAQLQTAETALDESKRANEIVTASALGYKKYQRANKELSRLETRKEERDRFQKQVQSVELTLNRLEQRILSLKQSLVEVEEAEQRISELEPYVQKQIEFETRVIEAKDHVKERDRLLQELSYLESQVEEKKSYLEALHAQLIQRSELENELREKTAERISLLTELQGFSEKILNKQKEGELVSKQLQQALLDKQSWETACKQRDNLTGDLEKDQQALHQLKEKTQQRNRLEAEQQTQEQEKGNLLVSLTEFQREFALCKHKIEELKIHLSLLQTAESAECPICRRSLSDFERDNVEADFVKDEQTWSERLRVAESNESVTANSAHRMDRRLKEIQALLKELPSESQFEEIKVTIEEKKLRLDVCQDQINRLAESPKSAFDLQSTLDLIEETSNDLIKQKETLENKRNRLDQVISLINSGIATLPSDSLEKKTKVEISCLEEKVHSGRLAAKKLAGAEQDMQKASAELENLGDPRTEQNRSYGIASRRLDLEKALQSCGSEKNETLAKKADHNLALQAFANLDQKIGEMKSALCESEQDYLSYERNLQTAQTLKEHQTKFDELQQQQADQTVELDHLQAEKNRVRVGYDSTYHEEIRTNYEQLQSNIITLSAKLEEWRKQLEIAKNELSELEQQQEQLHKVDQEVRRLEKLRGIFEFVRNSIKRASPDIVRRRVRTVSYTADRIFQDILGDLMLTLIWDESYAINVRSGQQERVFEQLSGGEQMAASIAVRLALLLHMTDSNIRWLFLDEPTANLDDKRRDKLADRITHLDQLDQIFVITHDDAFDRDTHHLIQISKLNGVSAATSIR